MLDVASTTSSKRLHGDASAVSHSQEQSTGDACDAYARETDRVQPLVPVDASIAYYTAAVRASRLQVIAKAEGLDLYTSRFTVYSAIYIPCSFLATKTVP